MGCGCFAALFAVTVPRFTLAMLWIFTSRLTIAFDSFLIGFLGFLFLPYTTVFYALAYAPIGEVTGFGWILVAFGVFLDLSSYAGSARTRREQRRLA